jgi:hypothetical protein
VLWLPHNKQSGRGERRPEKGRMMGCCFGVSVKLDDPAFSSAAFCLSFFFSEGLDALSSKVFSSDFRGSLKKKRRENSSKNQRSMIFFLTREVFVSLECG